MPGCADRSWPPRDAPCGRRTTSRAMAPTASAAYPAALVFGGEGVADHRQLLVLVEPHGDVADQPVVEVGDRQLQPAPSARHSDELGVVDDRMRQVARVGERPILVAGDVGEVAVSRELGDVVARQAGGSSAVRWRGEASAEAPRTFNYRSLRCACHVGPTMPAVPSRLLPDRRRRWWRSSTGGRSPAAAGRSRLWAKPLTMALLVGVAATAGDPVRGRPRLARRRGRARAGRRRRPARRRRAGVHGRARRVRARSPGVRGGGRARSASTSAWALLGVAFMAVLLGVPVRHPHRARRAAASGGAGLAGAVVFYACVISAMVITAWGTRRLAGRRRRDGLRRQRLGARPPALRRSAPRRPAVGDRAVPRRPGAAHRRTGNRLRCPACGCSGTARSSTPRRSAPRSGRSLRPGVDFFEAELAGFGRRWNYGVMHSTGVGAGPAAASRSTTRSSRSASSRPRGRRSTASSAGSSRRELVDARPSGASLRPRRCDRTDDGAREPATSTVRSSSTCRGRRRSSTTRRARDSGPWRRSSSATGTRRSPPSRRSAPTPHARYHSTTPAPDVPVMALVRE